MVDLHVTTPKADHVSELRARAAQLDTALRKVNDACVSTLALWKSGDGESAPSYRAYRRLCDGWRELYHELDEVHEELRCLTGEDPKERRRSDER